MSENNQMQRVFLTDRFSGWYARMVQDDTEVTFGPFSEAECDEVLAQAKEKDIDDDSLDELFERVKVLIMVKLGDKWAWREV